jgi:hypothetical protein
MDKTKRWNLHNTPIHHGQELSAYPRIAFSINHNRFTVKGLQNPSIINRNQRDRSSKGKKDRKKIEASASTCSGLP